MSPLLGPDFCPRCGQTDVAGTDHSCRPVPDPPARLGIPERRAKSVTARIRERLRAAATRSDE